MTKIVKIVGRGPFIGRRVWRIGAYRAMTGHGETVSSMMDEKAQIQALAGCQRAGPRLAEEIRLLRHRAGAHPALARSAPQAAPGGRAGGLGVLPPPR